MQTYSWFTLLCRRNYVYNSVKQLYPNKNQEKTNKKETHAQDGMTSLVNFTKHLKN